MIANHIWEYCKINYTSQKTKNLIEIHASKYKQIAEDIGFKTVNPPKFLREDEKEWIQSELTAFLAEI